MSEYINANELKERIEKELNTTYVFDKYDSGCRDTLNWILYSVIAKLSAADVAPVVHGHWIREYHENDVYLTHFVCSNCKTCIEMTGYERKCSLEFCPGCGAKMDEREENR